MSYEHEIHPHDDIAAYAVDALEPDERAALEAHLAVCPTCQREVDGHRATLARLGSGTAEVPPPPEVWEGIAARLGTRPTTSLDEARVRRRSGGGRVSLLLLAAAAVVVLVVGVAVVARQTADDGTPDVAELAADAATDSRSEVSYLMTDDGTQAARVVRAGSGDYVIFDELEPLPAGRAYQLWSTTDPDQPISLGVLGTGDEGAVQLSLPPTTTTFALSEEPAGGSPVPTTVVAHT